LAVEESFLEQFKRSFQNMAKTELTKSLEKLIWNATVSQGTFGCFEVTIGWFGRTRVDYMTMDTDCTFRFYEIKVSKSDFYSKSDHTFLGHFNYYVMPDELYEIVKNDIPKHIGVHNGTKCIKKPVQQNLKIDPSDLKGYMVRSLCRDVKKMVNAENPTSIEILNREIQEERRMKKYYEKQFDLKCDELYKLKNPQKYMDNTKVLVEPHYEGDTRCGIGIVKKYGSFGYDILYENGKIENYVKDDRIKRL
jgi:hypothetical protein